MGEVPQLSTTIQKTLELASRCTQAESSDNYGALGDQVEELESQAREAFQSRMDFASFFRISDSYHDDGFVSGYGFSHIASALQPMRLQPLSFADRVLSAWCQALSW
jgi:hypothetical protein